MKQRIFKTKTPEIVYIKMLISRSESIDKRIVKETQIFVDLLHRLGTAPAKCREETDTSALD